MNKLTFPILATISLSVLSNAVDPTYLKSWATYRLTEMFDHQHNKSALENHFSATAWKNFESALVTSNIEKHQKDDHYETRISQFITPVNITRSDDHNYFAQAVFLVSFQNEHSSWQQPLELILTLNDEEGDVTITDFEGKSAAPQDVKNYALDRAKACHQ